MAGTEAISVIFEDEYTLVINKPFGVVVNRAESVVGETVQDWVEKYLRFGEMDFSGENERDVKLFKERSGVCHRLDKETSGCLVIAKSPKSLVYYLKLFKERKIKKIYTALVHGRVEPKEGEVVLPLKRSLFDREKWQVHYEGKRAVTAWTVKARYQYPGTEHFKNALTLLSLNLKTGRTHQIRVHLSFLGWPIFADEKYLNKEVLKKDRELLGHHFLHAGFLEFKAYKGERVQLQSELPQDALDLLSGLLLE